MPPCAVTKPRIADHSSPEVDRISVGQIKVLEPKRAERRRSLFDAQDQVDQQRDELIAKIEGKLVQTTTMASMFTVRRALG